jgi:hypothetical protein
MLKYNKMLFVYNSGHGAADSDLDACLSRKINK